MAAKKLVRPIKGKVIAGVAMGIANYFKVDVTFIRIIWLILLLPGGIPGLISYIIFWVAMPNEQ